MFNDDPLKIDRRPGKSADTLIYSLTGPLLLRNMFDLQAELRKGPTPPLTILDLTAVPYMDSAGIGLVVNHHVHCQNKGLRLVVVGVAPRVMEVFKIIKVDAILKMTDTVEAAEAEQPVVKVESSENTSLRG